MKNIKTCKVQKTHHNFFSFTVAENQYFNNVIGINAFKTTKTCHIVTTCTVS